MSRGRIPTKTRSPDRSRKRFWRATKSPTPAGARSSTSPKSKRSVDISSPNALVIATFKSTTFSAPRLPAGRQHKPWGSSAKVSNSRAELDRACPEPGVAEARAIRREDMGQSYRRAPGLSNPQGEKPESKETTAPELGQGSLSRRSRARLASSEG